MNVFHQRSGRKRGCLPLPLPFNTVLKVLATVIKQDIETKGTQTEKKEVKFLYFQTTQLSRKCYGICRKFY